MGHYFGGYDLRAVLSPEVSSASSRARVVTGGRIRRTSVLIGIGIVAGALSGLFGVGGGVILVPALMTVLRHAPRRAASTSLLAIAPSSLVGALSYGMAGSVDLISAALLVVGSLAGATIGARISRRLPEHVLPYIFVGFVGVLLVSLSISAPNRDNAIDVDVVTGGLLVLVGTVAGIFSALVGVGGGIVAVPGMQLLLGAGDLVAKGTSLAMVVPTAVTGAISQARRGNVDVVAGLVIGVTAAAAAPAGVALSRMLSADVASVAFRLFLVAACGLVLWRARLNRATSAEG